LVCPAASLAVSSPSAFSWTVSSHIHPRFPSLGYGTFSAFPRSQGLDPLTPCRPCFMPDPPMGFPFRADFHLQSRATSRSPIPSCGWSENLHFRVLIPASVLFLRAA
jgi:hypothetical protein